MSRRTVPLKLVPPGLLVDRHEIGVDGIVVHAHGASATSACPTCGLASSSVHSRYGRTLGHQEAIEEVCPHASGLSLRRRCRT